MKPRYIAMIGVASLAAGIGTLYTPSIGCVVGGVLFLLVAFFVHGANN